MRERICGPTRAPDRRGTEGVEGRYYEIANPGIAALAGALMFLAAWLLHSIRLAAALGVALLVMQAPALTREYQAALLQLIHSSEQEIAQRKASAQRFYGIAPDEDQGHFLAQLRAVEPSNAETLAAAFARERSLRASYDRIDHSPDLLRPVVAVQDVAADEGGPRRQIAQTMFDSFAPQLDLSSAAAVYGLFGLFLGALAGELLTAALLPRRQRLME